MSGYTEPVLIEVEAEREAQDIKWGVQRLADLAPGDDGTVLLGRSYAVLAARLKDRCDQLRDRHLTGGPDHRNMAVVALEEVFEALEQAVAGDPAALRAELVQCAAVFVKWIEIIDHRQDTEIDRRTHGLYASTGRALTGDESRALRPRSRPAGGKHIESIVPGEGVL